MKLHHIGKVVKDLDEAVKYHRETFGLEPIGERVIDPIQKVEVVTLNTGYGEDLTLELICPISDDSPVNKFLKKGGGLHHLSFEVENIQQAIAEFRDKGALILGEVVPSAGHKAIPSVWLYTRSRELIELMEVSSQSVSGSVG
ncbi:MAG: VOC family protein [Candidatus Aminicenantes bacterium]|jgi:methylmalonyl-CoA/ethylmalonyl-CoA epimerase